MGQGEFWGGFEGIKVWGEGVFGGGGGSGGDIIYLLCG